MPSSWFDSSSSQSHSSKWWATPGSTSPRSVATAPAIRSDRIRKPTGSPASCEIGKEEIESSPIWSSSPVRKILQQSLSRGSGSSALVPLFMKIGISMARATLCIPPLWSRCPWVRRTASIPVSSNPAFSRRLDRERGPKPRSTRIEVFPSCTRVQLPLLPLPRTQILTLS